MKEGLIQQGRNNSEGLLEQIQNYTNVTEYKRLTVETLEQALKSIVLPRPSRSYVMSVPNTIFSGYADTVKEYTPFAPPLRLINKYFKGKTRIFIKNCRKQYLENPFFPNLRSVIQPNVADLDKIRNFLFLYNATLEIDHFQSVIMSDPIYLIKLHENPE